jgi:hypothetical protein
LSTQVSAFQPVQGRPALLREPFLGEPDWLPQANQIGEGRWTMRVRGGRVSRQVVVQVGDPWTAGSTTWRALSWDPVELDESERASSRLTDRLLPSFDGELGIDLREHASSLVLDGRYQPPGGRVGAAIDSVALHRLARTTVERLLADVAAALTERASALQVGCETGAGPGDGDGGDEHR